MRPLSSSSPYSFTANSRLLRRWLSATLLLVGSVAPRPLSALQIDLRWADNSSNESGFRVERATGSGSYAQIASTGTNVTQYSDTTVAANTTYSYRVKAYNSTGVSAYSNIASVSTGGTSGNTAPTISSIADQMIAMNGTTSALAFTIGDAQTSASNLTLIKNASDTSLVPLGNITFGGSGSSRTVTVRPASNRTGTSTIWVKVSDGSLNSYISFQLTVGSTSGGGNTAPTISAISDRAISTNSSTGAISFTIGDAQTSASSLTLIKNASDTSLVPLNNIVFGGSGANRTVTITPAASKSGWSTIWLKVSDGSLSSYISFKLTVNAVGSSGGNTAPTITTISDRTIGVNGSTGAIAFTVGDAETSASSLAIITNTSDQSLVPPSRVSVGGSGANRTVTVTPVSNKSGWTTVWVKVSDGQLTRTVSFILQVTATTLTYHNVGSDNVQGSCKENDPYVKMYARGADIYGTSDEFYFGEMALNGDTEMIVKVNSLDGPDPWSKAGLMFRSSNEADAAYVAAFVTPGNGVVLQWRSETGGYAESSPTLPRSAPRWLWLLRDGNAFHAFSSSDGANWEWIESVSVDLPDTVHAGLAVVSHDPTAGATALFQNLSID